MMVGYYIAGDSYSLTQCFEPDNSDLSTVNQAIATQVSTDSVKHPDSGTIEAGAYFVDDRGTFDFRLSQQITAV